FERERKRDVHRDRRLADAALARRDRDQVVDPGQRLQPMLHGVRDDSAADLEHDAVAARQRATVSRERFAELGGRVSDGETTRHRGLETAFAARDGEYGPGFAERTPGLRNGKFT